MTYFDATLLGVVQGLTEFLPVSSSGHLVLVQEYLRVHEADLAFDLVLHLGTLVAVFIYFRSAIWRLIRALFGSGTPDDRKMIIWLVIGTIPAGVIGVLFEEYFEQAFGSPVSTSWELIVTGLILLATRFVRAGQRPISLMPTIWMGIGQAVAIMPGISRSGTTIAAGLFAGVKPSVAAEFSFLLSIPAIAGAVLLKSGEIVRAPAALYGPYLAGFLFSLVFGLLSVYVVLTTVKRGRFDWFAYYCFAVGALGLYLFL
ncbi:MAG: undecaprenyl-diphosphate phosphatase [Candidatus Zixiibacteriota bacterium]